MKTKQKPIWTLHITASAVKYHNAADTQRKLPQGYVNPHMRLTDADREIASRHAEHKRKTLTPITRQELLNRKVYVEAAPELLPHVNRTKPAMLSMVETKKVN